MALFGRGKKKEEASPSAPQPVSQPVSQAAGGDSQAAALFQQGCVLYKAQRYQEMIPYFEKSAQMGHMASQFLLGCFYRLGQGVAQDLGKELY